MVSSVPEDIKWSRICASHCMIGIEADANKSLPSNSAFRTAGLRSNESQDSQRAYLPTRKLEYDCPPTPSLDRLRPNFILLESTVI